MKDYLFVASGALIAVELFVRMGAPRQIRSMLEASGRASRVIASKRISDQWKERALPRYSRRIMVSSLFLALALLSVTLAILVFGWAWHAALGFDRDLASLFRGPDGWLVGLLAGLAWLRVRPNSG